MPAIPTIAPMGYMPADASWLSVADSSATFSVTSIAVINQTTGGSASAYGNTGKYYLAPGIYELQVGYYGSRRVGFITYYAKGTKKKTFRIFYPSNVTATLSGGSISGPIYSRPSLDIVIE